MSKPVPEWRLVWLLHLMSLNWRYWLAASVLLLPAWEREQVRFGVWRVLLSESGLWSMPVEYSVRESEVEGCLFRGGRGARLQGVQ